MRPIDDVLIGGGRTFRDDMIDIRRTVELPDWAAAETWQLGLSAVIEIVDPGAIERSMGKARRVIDRRSNG